MQDFKRIARLFVPIFVEQFAAVAAGFVSTALVAGVSDAAVAGIGLVNNINFVVINAFIAVATGATVVAAQRFGARDNESARKTASESISAITYISLALAVIMLVFNRPLLETLFKGAETAVIDAAESYLFYSSLSMPFLAVCSGVSGVMRSAGEMKLPMVGGVIANVLNAAIAAVAIYPLGQGADGAGQGILFSRVITMFVMVTFLQRGHGPVSRLKLAPKLSLAVIAPVMAVAVPSALDSIIFNGSKVVIQVFMADMGTDVLNAYAVLNNISSFVNVPSGALSTLAISLVGFAYGEGDGRGAFSLTRRMTVMGSLLALATCLLVFAFLHPLIMVFQPNENAYGLIYWNMVILLACTPPIWTASFLTPNCLRAVGRAKYTMWVSIGSMIILRVFGSWLFGVALGFGLYGIWSSMILDWVGRMVFFLIPCRSERAMFGKDTQIVN